MEKVLTKMSNKRVLFIVFLAVVLLTIVFIAARIVASNNNSRKMSPSVINVTAEQIQPKTVPTLLHSIGSLSAKQSISISPEVAGQINSILFQYGQMVKKGESLYQLDDQLFQAQYLSAKSDLHLSKLTFDRSSKLIQKNAISKQALDKIQSAYDDKQSALKVLQVKLNKMLIRAPFSGVIGASQVDSGQYVSVGEPLVKLVDKTHLIVKFSIPEQYLNEVKFGQQVSIQSSAFPNQSFSGKVSYVSPTIDQSSRTLMVWAAIPNPDLKLAPGLFVHATLTLKVKDNVLLIPQEALIPTVEGNDVFIVKNGKAYKKSVIVTQMLGDQAEIEKGIQAGDTVVTQGQEKLANGRAVKVVSS